MAAECFFYVPIKETLQAMFHDASIHNYLQERDKTTRDFFELCDICDASCCPAWM